MQPAVSVGYVHVNRLEFLQSTMGHPTTA